MTSTTIADGRVVTQFADEAEMSAELVAEVTRTMKEAIANKGSFSFCIPAGSAVAALKALDPNAVDYSKVNIFFTGERLGANKSWSAALEQFCNKCKIKNVFNPLVRPLFCEGTPLPAFAVHEAAGSYAGLLKTHPSIDNSGPVPSVDLLLLGVGEDGHCGSLHPKSDHVKANGDKTVVWGLDKKAQIAISMDVMCASKKVLLAACGPKKAAAVKAALSGDFPEHECPAGLVKGGKVIWYTDKASMGDFVPK